jgi:hypothetical protein
MDKFLPYFYKKKNNKFVSVFYAGLEVLKAVLTENPIFWDITVCSLLKVNKYFERTCYLSHAGILLGSFFEPED